jgi:hypothetical protein
MNKFQVPLKNSQNLKNNLLRCWSPNPVHVRISNVEMFFAGVRALVLSLWLQECAHHGQTLVIVLPAHTLFTSNREKKKRGREREKEGEREREKRGRESRMTDHGQILALDIVLPELTE